MKNSATTGFYRVIRASFMHFLAVITPGLSLPLPNIKHLQRRFSRFKACLSVQKPQRRDYIGFHTERQPARQVAQCFRFVGHLSIWKGIKPDSIGFHSEGYPLPALDELFTFVAHVSVWKGMALIQSASVLKASRYRRLTRGSLSWPMLRFGRAKRMTQSGSVLKISRY